MYALIALYIALGVSFLAYLSLTLMAQPLFPFKLHDVDWSSAWLLTTVGDYYVSTFCLVGVILHTEGLAAGMLWSLATCLLGSPFACAWVAQRLWHHETLALVDADDILTD